MKTYRNTDESWGDSVGGLTVDDYMLQAGAFARYDGTDTAIITSDARHIYADGVAVADAEPGELALEIMEAKKSAGDDAFLWVHDSGDVILWPNEATSRDDDGARAMRRWHVDADTVADLVESDAADEVA